MELMAPGWVLVPLLPYINGLMVQQYLDLKILLNKP